MTEMAEQHVTPTTAPADGSRERLRRHLISALAVAVALQGRTMAYYNYSLWRLEFMAVEVATAVLGAVVALFALRDLDERGARWAAGYVEPGSGALWRVLSKLPSSTGLAAIMLVGLSVVNVLVVGMGIYRETFGNVPAAIVARYLADLPAGVLVCLLVWLVLERVAERKAAAKTA